MGWVSPFGDIRGTVHAMKTTNLFLVGLVILLLSSTQALAGKKGVWIASGTPGGTYRDVYAPNLGNRMHDYELLYLSSGGSRENLALLAKGEADLAFAQADVYAGLLNRDPEQYGDLIIVGRLASECVYLAFRKDGPIKSLEQLASPQNGRVAKVAVGSLEGGMSGTWIYFTHLVPGLANAKATDNSGTLALNQLELGAFDAVGWVTDPTNYDHKMLRAAVANKSIGIMNLKDPALTSALSNGTTIYKPEKVRLSDSWRSPTVETVCTSGLVFARANADKKLIDKVADLLSLRLEVIVPPKPSPKY
jgi:TRAP-type uncharacterized transport system substrate-binding protein